MDTETIDVIDRLRGDLHQVEVRLTVRIDGLDARIDRLDARVGGLDARVGGLDERIDGLDERIDGLDERIGGLDERQERRFEDTRRHLDVIAESLHDDIRMIAEGLVALSGRVDLLRR